jgi:hypothetical protein
VSQIVDRTAVVGAGIVDWLARDSWLGGLSGLSRGKAEGVVVAAFHVADSGCKPFLGLADDGKQYWVKHMGNDHGVQSLVIERVVAAVGEMILAPVRPVALLEVGDAIASDSMLRKVAVRPGLAHGSLHLDDAIEKEELTNTRDDSNRFRQPRFIALWELFAGEDPQWLYCKEDDYSIWTFDHGFWVTGGEMGDWSGDDLARMAPVTSPWQHSVAGMDAATFHDVAESLESLTVEDILGAVATVPVAWGVPDADLETLAWWVYCRRQQTAQSMRALSNSASRR